MGIAFSALYWWEIGLSGLLPEFGLKPVNKYLPPRNGTQFSNESEHENDIDRKVALEEKIIADGHALTDKLFAWTDRILSR